MSKLKIIKTELKGDMIKIKTNDKDRPDFVYFADKFPDKASLLKEIEKSLAISSKKKEKKNKKIKKLEEELCQKQT